jgi:SNF2 family DNA or RNA helicase
VGGKPHKLDAHLEFEPTFPSCKYDAMVAKLAELGIDKDNDGINKVVIASQFTKFINLYAAQLRKDGIECVTLTGETSERNRVKAVESFQDDPNGPRVMLLQTMTGGVSITLDRADDVFLLDETWIPDDQDQVEGRVHRTSDVKHQVRCWYFVTEGTIEEQIGSVVDARDAGQRSAMDGRRGVEFARKHFDAKVKGKAA